MEIEEIVMTPACIKTNAYLAQVTAYFYLTQLRKVAVWMLTISAIKRKKSFSCLFSRKYRIS